MLILTPMQEIRGEKKRKWEDGSGLSVGRVSPLT